MLRISIDDADLQRNLRQLAEKEARGAASWALNDTAADVLTHVQSPLDDVFDRPSRVSVTDAAERSLRVPVAGKWSAYRRNVAPYTIEPQDISRSWRFKAVVFVGPSQSGKAQMLLCRSIQQPEISDARNSERYEALNRSMEEMKAMQRETNELLRQIASRGSGGD